MLLKLVYNGYMKFGLRNTSFVYPNGTGDIWADARAHIQKAERDGFDSFWVMDHLCMDFSGNDPESYALFANEVTPKLQ